MSLPIERQWSVGFRNEDGDLIELFYKPGTRVRGSLRIGGRDTFRRIR